MTIVDHGIPVITARQWTTALSPNQANNGWNYIVASFTGAEGVPVEWVVIKDLTTAPTQTIYDTTTHLYPNANFQEFNQLRALNGRIFFCLFGPATSYYDPTDAQVHELGLIVEDPPQNPNASTAAFSASFDVDGLLYIGSQESADRPACIFVTDTDTLVQTIIGYVGDNALGFTTYAYRLAPDTVTATKWIYVAYGEDPWQLWALNIETGDATKLEEVPATGNIQFQDITGQGWIAILDTDLGQPDNVRTKFWCLDGVAYAYTMGDPPPVTARNVTPASNPLTSPPELDTTRGIGEVGWRNGSSGPYTYVDYTVVYEDPVTIESLVTSSPDGIVGNVQQYSGFFQYFEPGDSHIWYGAWFGVSEGPRLDVSGTIYIAGYPNGVLYTYDPTADWDTLDDINPHLLGYYGLNGTQFAGIKYADALAWTALAGVSGRLYCCGERERNGTGCGIGYWDKTSGAFAGTYVAAGMTDVLPSGIVTLPLGQSPSLIVLEGISRVVMSTRNISGSGTAPLYLFDYDLNYVGQLTPLAGVANLGNIYKTSTANVIAGIVQGSGNSIGLYQYNVQTQTLVTHVEIPIIGTLGAATQQPSGAVWIMSDLDLVEVNVDTLTAVIRENLIDIEPVKVLAFSSNGTTLFIAAGSPSGVDGAQLFSTDTNSAVATICIGASANFVRFLISGPSGGTPDPITMVDLLAVLPAGALRKLALAYANGLGKLLPGAKTQAQSRAIWLSTNNRSILGSLISSAVITLTARLGGQPFVDADVDGGGIPVIQPGAPSGAFAYYLDIEIPGSIGR